MIINDGRTLCSGSPLLLPSQMTACNRQLDRNRSYANERYFEFSLKREIYSFRLPLALNIRRSWMESNGMKKIKMESKIRRGEKIK